MGIPLNMQPHGNLIFILIYSSQLFEIEWVLLYRIDAFQPNSINLLCSSGINFNKLKENGID